jgi:type II restriction/modification system DNA methylase subunit YeeA
VYLHIINKYIFKKKRKMGGEGERVVKGLFKEFCTLTSIEIKQINGH